MAISFASQIQALTGFESKSSAAVDSETGDDFAVLAAQWMDDACKEVINILPPKLLERVSNVSGASGTANYTNGTGVTHEQKVTGALRAITTEFNDGDVYICRPISHLQSYKAADPNNIEFATETDPVYYTEPKADGTAGVIKVLPSSSLALAKVLSIDYPSFDAAGGDANDVTSISTIPNFPDEVVYLVVLRASIYAGQYLLAIEQDEDLYEPIIEGLEKRYKEGLTALQTKKLGDTPSKSKGKGLDMNKLLQGMAKGKK